MKNPIRKFNIWFDTVEEPKRFGLFMLLAACWLFPLWIAEYCQRHGYSTTEMVFGTIGITWLTIMVIIAIDRVIYLRK